MTVEIFNKGIIHTSMEGCMDCNKCIHECPVIKANVCVQYNTTSYKMCVDEAECILCGTCISACTRDVRHFRDDCGDFLADLKRGEAFSVLVAPSFYLNYPNEYPHVLGYLQSLGVKNFYSVGFGADIAVWGYIRYIEKNKGVNHISQPCPSIVRNIEIHMPELLPNLVPVQSPLMCTAIYLKRYLGIEENLAFLSPCVAKKVEIESPRGLGLVQHNITYTNLMAHIREEKINLHHYPCVEDALGCGMGSIFPKPGALATNIEYYLGPQNAIMQVEGGKRAYNYLRALATRVGKPSSSAPLIIDILNCANGCNHGTGTDFFNLRDDDDIAYQTFLMRKKNHEALPPAKRLEKLNERFKELKLADFICTYDTNAAIPNPAVSDEDINAILRDTLKKYTVHEQTMNCFACGYASCRHMAEAIATGINHRENCVYYVKYSLAESIVELTEAEERLRIIIDNTPLVMGFMDTDHRMLECNGEAVKLFGLRSKEEFLTMFPRLSPLFQPDGTLSEETSAKYIKRAFKVGHIRFEWMHQKLNGELLPCEVTLIRVRRHEETLLLTFLRDLREHYRLLEAENAIQQSIKAALDREQAANQAKSRFLSNMSHEIRTPMGAIIGMTSIAKGTTDPDKKDHCLTQIDKASNHLLGIINQILDMSKIEAEKFELDIRWFELTNMIDKLISVLSIHIEEKALRFSVKLDEHIPRYILSDELRIAQVITNLISNAIKFTPAGGEITLSVELCGGSGLYVEVADSGIGIHKEHQERLFNAFEQAEASITRKFGGTGLGLTISKHIVEIMNGTIWMKSEPNVGTTVMFIVPFEPGSLDEAADRTPHDQQHEELVPGCFEGYTMLLVEDVDVNREIIMVLLEATGLTIDCASDGEKALRMFKHAPQRYDVILMDLQMPVMDGLTATRRIRKLKQEEAATIPIVAMTANVFQEDIETCLSAGMNGHLGKPLNINQLMGMLRKYLTDAGNEEPVVVQAGEEL
ncbi:MAG: ATP-binding protein [Defluviitaleaceae bacterium]|nr:ATP-binding protein [Defluviitaleaceae bacterium]MCL2240682.1 ATP-binding protein [Defluviitaleaceae bacterium]